MRGEMQALFALKVLSGNSCVTVHGLSMPAHCNRILPMLRIPNRQIRGHNCIIRNFQFRKFLPVKSNPLPLIINAFA